MPRNSQDVTDAELAVLRVLWEQGATSIREITEQVYSRNTESDYATVKKLLARLERKEFVSRDRSQLAHTFSASVTLDELLARRLQGIADNLCEGSQTPLLMQLIRNEGVTPNQRKKLRDLIDEISNTTTDKSKKRRS